MRKDSDSMTPTPLPAPRDRPTPRRRRSLSPSRRAIVERLQSQPDPVAIHAIAMITRLHENTVREHLDGLIAVGLVTRIRSTPVGRGRPAWLYRHADVEDSRSALARRGYELASKLGSSDVGNQSQELGASWGREILQSPDAPHSAPLPIESVEGFPDPALAVLHEIGFKPRAVAPGCLLLGHCPQLQQAIVSEGAVCALNEAMLQEVLRGTGHEDEAEQLQVRPCSMPGGCLVSIGTPDEALLVDA